MKYADICNKVSKLRNLMGNLYDLRCTLMSTQKNYARSLIVLKFTSSGIHEM